MSARKSASNPLTHPSRRALLAGLGSSGAATVLPWLRPGRAQAATIPTRVIFFWSGSGVPRHTYNFKSAGGGAPTATDFVFPEVRSPLNAIKKDLVVFENLDMVSVRVDPRAPSNAHFEGETHSLAATNRADGETAGGPSIDQYIAKAINSPNPVTKFPSLSLMVQVDGNVSYIKVCTAGSGQVISLNPSPQDVYKRLFSTFKPPAMGGGTPTGPTPEQIAAEQQKSVLDLVLDDFATVKGRLPAAQHAKWDAHASAVRDLEKRLALMGGSTGGVVTPGTSCKDPTSTVLAGAGNGYPGTAAMYRANFDAMSRLVQSAFACDLTRVVLMGVAEPFGSDYGYTSGNYGTSDAHDLVHKTSYNNAGTLKNNADAMATVLKMHQLECQQYVKLLDLLRQIPESDGKTMLDHTIVVWCSQIGEHGHETDHLPWMLAGGSAAGFNGGRYLKLPRGSDNRGVPHNNLFVSIAQAMGVQTNTFGNASVCTGPLAGLRA